MPNRTLHRSTFLLAAALGLALADLSPAQAEGAIGTNGGPVVAPETCIVYEHINFNGERKSIHLGRHINYVGDDWNDRVSSMHIRCDRPAANDCSYGPETCMKGFVWREAFDGGRVCVPPPSRDQARSDNQLASARIACRKP